MFKVAVGEYEVSCQDGGVPDLLPEYMARAALAERFDGVDGASACFVAVGRAGRCPFLVVTQRRPPEGGFHPGLLVVPETDRLFLGVGPRLLGYDLAAPARLWEDATQCGFYSWGQHGRTVLMAAELELAAWDAGGAKLWTRYVEPPWDFAVQGEVVTVNVMGTVTRVDLRRGCDIP